MHKLPIRQGISRHRLLSSVLLATLLQAASSIASPLDAAPGTDTSRLLQQGRQALLQGHNSLAESNYSDALLLGASTGEAMTGLAEAYYRQGNYQALLSKLPLRNASSLAEAEVMGYHAMAYLQLGKAEQASTSYNRALEQQPRAVMPQVARIQLLLTAGMAAEARLLAQALTARAPTSARAWQSLGMAAQLVGAQEQAIAAYAEATHYDPQLRPARINRIRLLLGMERVEAAAADLAYTAQHYPQVPTAAFLRGLAAEHGGDDKAATIAFGQASDAFAGLALKRVASDPQATIAAATAHLRLGDSDGARHYLEASRALGKNNRHITLMLAALLLQHEEPDRALHLVDEMLLRDPGDPDLLGLKAHCQQLLGAAPQPVADR